MVHCSGTEPAIQEFDGIIVLVRIQISTSSEQFHLTIHDQSYFSTSLIWFLIMSYIYLWKASDLWHPCFVLLRKLIMPIMWQLSDTFGLHDLFQLWQGLWWSLSRCSQHTLLLAFQLSSSMLHIFQELCILPIPKTRALLRFSKQGAHLDVLFVSENNCCRHQVACSFGPHVSQSIIHSLLLQYQAAGRNTSVIFD